jgi:hypothetical protein
MRSNSCIFSLILFSTTIAFAQNNSTERFPGWNISYQIPTNWRVQQTLGRTHMLSAGTPNQLIFVAPGMYTNANEVQNDVTLFLQAQNTAGSLTEQPASIKFGAYNGVAATLLLQNQQMGIFSGEVIALFTPHGTGVIIMAAAPAAQFSQIVNLAQTLAASVRAQAPQVNPQTVAMLAGSWVYYAGRSSSSIANSGSSSSSYEEAVRFDGRGNFQWRASSHVSVDSRVTEGGYSSGASNFGGDQDAGTYMVIGHSLILKGSKGQLVTDFLLQGGKLVAGGKTYLRQ